MKKGSQKSSDQARITTILDAYNKDVKRHMSALAEDFQGRVSAVAEQFLGVNKKLDSLDQKVGSLDQKLDSHTEMIGNMAVDLETVKADIAIIKNGLRKKVDHDEFVALEKRVTLIESRIRR